MSAEAHQCLCLCREAGGCLCNFVREDAMDTIEELEVTVDEPTPSQKRLAKWQRGLIGLDNSLKWIEDHLDSFPEIPSISFYPDGSGTVISFGYITTYGDMQKAIHAQFSGQTAKSRLSGTTTNFELIDSHSGLKFIWYVFKSESFQNVETEVVL